VNYLDVLLASIIVVFAYRGISRGGYRSFVSLVQNLLAAAVASYCHIRVLAYIESTRIHDVIEQGLEVSMTVPTGPGSSIEQALGWLRDADLPKTIAQAIKLSWERDSTADVAALSLAASHVIAKAALSLACFITLFLLMRWLINLFSAALLKALPLEVGQAGRALGLTLGIIESIVISILLIALFAPFAATTLLPQSVIESYKMSRLAGLWLALVERVGPIFYRL